MSAVNQLKLVQILFATTSKMLSQTKFGPILMVFLWILREDIIKNDLHIWEDKRILFKSCLLTFASFSSFHTENLAGIFPILKFWWFYVLCTKIQEILKIGNFESKISDRKLENEAKVKRQLLNKILLSFKIWS